MIHISGYFTYPAMVWSRCRRISEGPLYKYIVYMSSECGVPAEFVGKTSQWHENYTPKACILVQYPSGTA